MRSRRHAHAGQSVVEFAVVLPVLFALLGVTVDFARLYQGWVNLESATRDAAEYLATSNVEPSSPDYTVPNGTATANNDKAIFILNTATGRTFLGSGTGLLPVPCSSPTVTTITSQDTSAASGASDGHPIQKAQVIACMPFRTLFSYPVLTTNGNWTLLSDRSYSVLVGR